MRSVDLANSLHAGPDRVMSGNVIVDRRKIAAGNAVTHSPIPFDCQEPVWSRRKRAGMRPAYRLGITKMLAE